jgi:hypothetical protein
MSELAEPVGATQEDADTITSAIGYSYSNPIIEVNGIRSWKISESSTGTSNRTVVYSDGDNLAADGEYYLYPAAPCFLTGTRVLVENGDFVPIENLKVGDKVKTSLDGCKRVVHIGKGKLTNPATSNRAVQVFYKYLFGTTVLDTVDSTRNIDFN